MSISQGDLKASDKRILELRKKVDPEVITKDHKQRSRKQLHRIRDLKAGLEQAQERADRAERIVTAITARTKGGGHGRRM